MKSRYFIDISTLMEPHFTGIANVVSELIKWFVRNEPAATLFFLQQDIVNASAVRTIIEARTGLARRQMARREFFAGTVNDALRADPYAVNVGLFGGVKQIRSVFDYEAQIIYDLTYVVVPEMHHADTVEAHGETIERDVKTNDLNICISDWTRRDLVTYVGAAEEKCIVAYLGCDEREIAGRDDVEPYYLMLGTVEPRKNHALVLRAIRDRPEFWKDRKLVIAGSPGWGNSFESLVQGFELGDLVGRQIYHFGFCSERMRAKLLRNARALLYPSLYEGFGLPVLEAMAVGTPVVTSVSSSLPEVGGDAALYIDPSSIDDLVSGVSRLEATLADPESAAKLQERMRRQVSKFSWEGFCGTIMSRIEADLKRQAHSTIVTPHAGTAQ